MRVVVAVNERGKRIGEDHPRAVLTNAEVDRLLVLREEGLSYGKLARMFDVSKSSVRYYCKGERRCQVAASFRVVHVSGESGC